jgi:periplasmic protein TonB
MELTPDLVRPEPAVQLDQNLREGNARARDQNNQSIDSGAVAHFIIASEDRVSEPQPRGMAFERRLLWILAASLTAHGLVLLAAAVFDPAPADRMKETPVEVVVETPAPFEPAPNGGPAPLAPKAEANSRPEEKGPATNPQESRSRRAEPPETKLSGPGAAEAKPPGFEPPETKPEKTKAASSKAAAQRSEVEPKHAERKPPAQVKASPVTRAAAQNRAASQIAAKTAAARETSGTRAADQWSDAGAQSHPLGGVLLPFDAGPEIFRAVAVPLPVEGGDEPLSYKEIVFGLLERAKQYPQAAKERGARGSAVVVFALDDKGELSEVSLVRSSGEADLDAESLALVARAAPFPRPPLGAQRAFAAEITFGLQKSE